MPRRAMPLDLAVLCGPRDPLRMELEVADSARLGRFLARKPEE